MVGLSTMAGLLLIAMGGVPLPLRVAVLNLEAPTGVLGAVAEP
jgi:hypothetical protein